MEKCEEVVDGDGGAEWAAVGNGASAVCGGQRERAGAKPAAVDEADNFVRRREDDG